MTATLTDLKSFAPVTLVDTQSTLTLSANGQTSQIRGFAVAVLVAEPGAWVLTSVGLLLLWWRLRRVQSGFCPDL
jgi:hypothetical protein